MAPGLIFTIEPMINAGTDRIYIDRKTDGPYIHTVVSPLLNGKLWF